MHRSTCTKIANQHAQPTPGWVVPDGAAPDEWLERAIKPLLAGLTTPPPRIERHHERPAQQPGQVAGDHRVRFIGWIHLAIEAKSHHDHHYHHPRSYYRNQQHALMVPLYWIRSPSGDHQVAIAPRRIGEHGYYHALPEPSELRYLAGPEALRTLLEALLEQLRQQDFKAQKVNKVRNLQTQAVQAQLRQIANEERFAFYVTTTARLIRIAVRLDGNNQLTISVPFSEFEKVLPQLRETVINLRALHQRRIHFRTHQCLYGSGTWIEPDPRPAVAPTSSTLPESF